jgi:site-specific recombinase XerD
MEEFVHTRSKLLAPIRVGADLAVVQRLAGHADSNTTAGYDRRDEKAKQSAVNKLHMAWSRRY